MLTSGAFGESALPEALSIFSGIFNVGIGAGALLGGFTAHHAGLPWIGVVGSVLALAGLGWCVYSARRFPVAMGK